MSLIEKLQWRYAAKKMDATKSVPQDKVERIIEAARQVMGTAGDMQVANVHNALATAAGGSTQFFTTTLISDEPRTGTTCTRNGRSPAIS